MKRLDARAEIVSRFLRSSGPVTLRDVCKRFGWTEKDAKSVLKSLVGEGKVAEGDLLPGRLSPQFCWQANLEELHRETLRRLKTEIEPLSLAEYQDFLLQWQHVYPATRRQGKGGLLDTIRQLEGYGTYPLLWKRDILSIRVADFERSWLSEFLEDGTLVFGRFCLMEDANFTPGAGVVLCEPCSLQYLLEWNPPEESWLQHAPWPGAKEFFDDCMAVYGAIVECTRAALDDIIARTGFEAHRAEQALWQLYCGGSATNTHADSMLDSTCIFFNATPPFQRYGLHAEKGQWMACNVLREEVSGEPPLEPERLCRRVLQALRMYGIASMSILERHFSALFGQSSGRKMLASGPDIRQACESLVARGEAVRGFFVRELHGAQYALPDVPGQARHQTAEKREPMLMINSQDPAALYISIIPVPSTNAYCSPGRFVVLDRGRLVAIVDQKRGARKRFVLSNVHAPKSLDPEGWCSLIDAVADFVRRSGSFDIIEVRAIETVPAAKARVAPVFLQRGFAVEKTTFRIRLDELLPWNAQELAQIEITRESDETDKIARIHAVLEQVAGEPIKRKRGQGHTALKYKGRMVVDCVDGRDPVLVSTSVSHDLEKVFAAIPKPLKAHASHSEDIYASRTEVRLVPETDFERAPFRRLVKLCIDHIRLRQKRAVKQSRDRKLSKEQS